MLNVGRIEEGFVLDHIKAGKAMTIYHDLGLDKLDCTVAIIKNAKSEKMGKVKTGKFDAFSKNETYASLHGIFPLTGREGQGYNAKDGKDAVA